MPKPKMSQTNKNMSRRRFEDEQIRYLERMFEAEARPELRVKQQLADKLGLLPKQVAIWFQNKRARSKSKVIEQEYSLLKASFDDLSSKFEALKRENHSLHIQVQRLRQLNNTEQEGSIKDIKKLVTTDEMLPGSFVVLEKSTTSHNLCKTPSTTENSDEKFDYLGEDSCGLHATQPMDGCYYTGADDDSCSFQTDDLLEHQNCNLMWWEWQKCENNS
ncbi:OLC1v1028855C1 [Oldenlandia corymbosa var. corymbosa]|uniref:Homeobox-leucine zipper protein n=1 Tax=Oldenlandia corymbosa var. corymbosa TaxID=529605 RepID=A0AAV1CFJ0_OLDCO|nr:OLC1v1028855C1 [Oldenlandia corymbosa var. corymbosa]